MIARASASASSTGTSVPASPRIDPTAPDRGSDDRHAGRHCLEDEHRHCLGTRWKNGNARLVERAHDLLMRPRPTDMRPFGNRGDQLRLGDRPQQEECAARMIGEHPRPCPQKGIDALAMANFTGKENLATRGDVRRRVVEPRPGSEVAGPVRRRTALAADSTSSLSVVTAAARLKSARTSRG